MALFRWSEKLSVKVEEFDQHHQKLMNLINTLHSNMMMGKGRLVLEPILNELREYTKYHFTAEELKMAKYGYPGLFEHKAQHKELLKGVNDICLRYGNGELEITGDLFLFLKDWLLTHICEQDRAYGEYFNEKGIY